MSTGQNQPNGLLVRVGAKLQAIEVNEKSDTKPLGEKLARRLTVRFLTSRHLAWCHLRETGGHTMASILSHQHSTPTKKEKETIPIGLSTNPSLEDDRYSHISWVYLIMDEHKLRLFVGDGHNKPPCNGWGIFVL
ncbi:MAG: hypothetical protein Q9M28_09450 [Mariprofundaceae bacterium]|nr:hypothetical protein [Mariprofundaceae bacterium]